MTKRIERPAPISHTKTTSKTVTSPDLDNLISSLDVRFVGLAECLVSSGHRLDMGSSPDVGIHYNVVGNGTMFVSDGSRIDLVPHTLIVLPPNHSYQIDVRSTESTRGSATRPREARRQLTSSEGVRRYIAGTTEPALILICGFFNASFGQNTELFATLRSPIVEVFSPRDQLDVKLKQALDELVAQEVGSGAMSSALLKQVIVSLMRRSLKTPGAWVERFAMLSDIRIARAFADMIAEPGNDHSVQSLAETACLSRSAFMARFAAVMGRSPMTVLRDLRMRRAAHVLEMNSLSVGQIAHEVGYASRSSFVRAFRQTYGSDPSEFRERLRTRSSDASCAASPVSVSPPLN